MAPRRTVKRRTSSSLLRQGGLCLLGEQAAPAPEVIVVAVVPASRITRLQRELAAQDGGQKRVQMQWRRSEEGQEHGKRGQGARKAT